MGVPTGNNLGTATGSIVINTAQAQQAPAVMRGVAQGINQSMASVGNSTNQAQAALGAFAGSFRGLVGALGAREILRFAVDVNEVATAFDRQAVAARSLAGSQAKVNELLAVYNTATGNAIDQATALSDVTRLISVGFADNVKELETFTRAVRGISLATGRPQDFVVTQLQLELLNQSGFRLDQIGLSMEEVRRKTDELRAANKGLTQEQAYQQAVLETANQKYAALTKSAEAQASGLERLATSWKNYRLAIGQLTQGPLDAFFGALAKGVDAQIEKMEDWLALIGQIQVGLRLLGVNTGLTAGERSFVTDSAGRDQARRGRGQGPKTPLDYKGIDAVRMDWSQGLIDLQKQTDREMSDESASYQRNRANSERDYQQTVQREAEDFATGRARQEQELADSIADVHEDAAQRELQMAADLARNIGRMQADNAAKLAEFARDRDERVAEAREDSQKRLVELEENYNQAREDAAESHRLKLLEAAGRLDARAIYLEQQRYKKQESDAKESYDEQRDDVKEKLDEQLEDINKSYARRVADEQAALAKSIAQANDAHARQLADARAADAQRIADMQADFAERTTQEDADRAVRLTRLAEDHRDQLDEMDRAHVERISQIARHAQDERDELDAQAKTDLLALEVRNTAWLAEQQRKENELEKLWNKFWENAEKTFTGTTPLPPGYSGGEDALPPGYAGVSSLPAAAGAMGYGGGNSFAIGDIHVSVAGSNASATDIAGAVRLELVRALQEVAA